MTRLLRSLAVVALLGASQPAHAEWGATRWGMTVDEVLAAAGDTARTVEDEPDQRIHEQRRYATSTVMQDGIEFTVSYYFARRSRGLTMVRLEPVAVEYCSPMRTALTQRLGAGIDQSRSPGGSEMSKRFSVELIHWPTGPGDEVVELTEVRIDGNQMFCHILYQQRDFVAN
jgi:hypothetical protein